MVELDSFFWLSLCFKTPLLHCLLGFWKSLIMFFNFITKMTVFVIPFISRESLWACQDLPASCLSISLWLTPLLAEYLSSPLTLSSNSLHLFHFWRYSHQCTICCHFSSHEDKNAWLHIPNWLFLYFPTFYSKIFWVVYICLFQLSSTSSWIPSNQSPPSLQQHWSW